MLLFTIIDVSKFQNGVLYNCPGRRELPGRKLDSGWRGDKATIQVTAVMLLSELPHLGYNSASLVEVSKQFAAKPFEANGWPIHEHRDEIAIAMLRYSRNKAIRPRIWHHLLGYKWPMARIRYGHYAALQLMLQLLETRKSHGV